MLVVSLGELDEIYETFLAWLRQEPKVSGCCLCVRACVRDIIQISTPEELLRVHKGLREGPKRGPKEGA